MVELIPHITWEEIANVILDPELTVGFAGPPGVGKTVRCFWLGEQLEKPTYKVQFHDELSPIEVMGASYPHAGSHIWVPGAGDRAYSEGGLLILDELDMASGPCKTLLYSLLDKGEGGTVEYIGRTFRQEPGYQAIATMNSDPTDGSLSPALLDRFDAWFLIPEPCEEQYALLDDDLADLCRSAYEGAPDKMAGPAYTYRMFRSLQVWRERLPLPQAVLAACHGQQRLAQSWLEVLILSDEEPEEEDE